jgi:diguanylate cyclase (GGDEF)-like protein/PAS domain S-box-containing protein
MSSRWRDRRQTLNAFFGGIQVRLIGMILLIAFPFAALQAFDLYKDRQSNLEAAHEKAVNSARRGRTQYMATVIEARTLLKTLALFPDVAYGSSETCLKFLEQAALQLAWADDFWVFGTDGKIRCATAPGAVGQDRSDREYIRQAIETGEFGVSDFIISRIRGTPSSVAILPVLDAKGKVTRILGISLRLSWFGHITAEFGAQSGAQVMLLDSKGTLLAGYPENRERIGKNWSNKPLMRHIMAASEGWAELPDEDGVDYIYGWTKIPDTNAHIAVGFRRAQALESINRQTLEDLAIFIAALILVSLAGASFTRNIVRPLKLLTAGAEHARHSKSASLPKVTGYDEVASLAASLDSLLADRQQREREIEHTERQAREAHDRLAGAIEMLPEAIAIFDAEDRFAVWNHRYAELFENDGRKIIRGMRFEDRLRESLALGQHPDAIGREEEWLKERLALHAQPESSYEQPIAGQRWVRVEERRMADGGTIGVRVDITELKQSEESLRLLFESNPVPMWVYDEETLRYLAVNDAAILHYGYSRNQFLSMTILDIRPPEDRDLLERTVRARPEVSGESRFPHLKADGTLMNVAVYARKLVYRSKPAVLVAIIDITERKQTENRIIHMAHHDAMTGLANRVLFRERLVDAVKRGFQDGGIAVLYLDLDGFKNVNDTLGHHIGDELLRIVAERLAGCVRDIDTVARLGGDEFAVIQVGIKDREKVAELATRIVNAISEPYHIDDKVLAISGSVGLATAPHDAEDPEHLLKYADLALYCAKTEGGGVFRLFEPHMDLQLQAKRALELDLRTAFANDEFRLHYQPSIDIVSNKVTGFEALLRWNHPERGEISPTEFVPIAENIGLISQIGEWVLRQACMEAARWPDHIRLSVNLSPVQFKNSDLVHAVLMALASSELPARRLELEITESVLLQENENNLATLHQLRALGVTIALDDFGTGYASLSYLRIFPFDRIKIDRSFVKELPGNSECVMIIRAMIELANGLNMATTAEGIESPEQLDHLWAAGCTEAQGYLFSRPRPATDIREMLNQRNHATRAA